VMGGNYHYFWHLVPGHNWYPLCSRTKAFM
jgi:hypothetical protein